MPKMKYYSPSYFSRGLTVSKFLDSFSSPGPGSYNFNDPWIKDFRKKIKKPILVNVDEEVKKNNNIKEKENKPDFNVYQKDGYLNIIQEISLLLFLRILFHHIHLLFY